MHLYTPFILLKNCSLFKTVSKTQNEQLGLFIDKIVRKERNVGKSVTSIELNKANELTHG